MIESLLLQSPLYVGRRSKDVLAVLSPEGIVASGILPQTFVGTGRCALARIPLSRLRSDIESTINHAYSWTFVPHS